MAVYCQRLPQERISQLEREMSKSPAPKASSLEGWRRKLSGKTLEELARIAACGQKHILARYAACELFGMELAEEQWSGMKLVFARFVFGEHEIVLGSQQRHADGLPEAE